MLLKSINHLFVYSVTAAIFLTVHYSIASSFICVFTFVKSQLQSCSTLTAIISVPSKIWASAKLPKPV